MLIDDADKFQYAIQRWKDSDQLFVLDLETTGTRPFHGNRIVGAALLVTEDLDFETFYFPWRHGGAYNLPIAWFKDFGPILADRDRFLLNQNTKFDVHFLEQEGFAVNNRQLDVMLAAHLDNENSFKFSLDYLAKVYLSSEAGKEETGMIDWAVENLGVSPKEVKAHIAQIPPEVVAPYAEGDTILAWQVYRVLLEKIQQQGLSVLLPEIMQYGQIVQRMEKRGVLINPRTAQLGLLKARRHTARLRKEMFKVAGGPFNPNSWRQKQKVLGITTSTAREHLEQMDHPLARLLIVYSQWSAAENNYYSKYLRERDELNRLRVDLAVTGTIAGRLSCRLINLQAVARDSEIYSIREVIEAPPGYVLLSADYSQAELRWMAFYTQDPVLLNSYRQDLDLHQLTADTIKITRQEAKTLNFSIIYGLGVEGAMKRMRWSQLYAKRVLSNYHQLYQGIKPLYRRCEKCAKVKGWIPLWTGRKRHYGPLQETHKAMSNLIQGGVAEMIRLAIIRLDQLLEGSRVRMILQIHDDIIFEIPEKEVDFWAPKIREIMQDFDLVWNGDEGTRVPMKVDMKVGKTWGSKMVKWEPAAPIIPPPTLDLVSPADWFKSLANV